MLSTGLHFASESTGPALSRWRSVSRVRVSRWHVSRGVRAFAIEPRPATSPRDFAWLASVVG